MFKEDWISSQYGRLGPWWLAKAYLEQDKAPNIVVFGNSQMGGVQASDAVIAGRSLDFVRDHESLTLERDLGQHGLKDLRCFTAALPGAMVSDHFLLSKTLFSKKLKPQVVVLGLAPRDIVDNTPPNETEPYSLFSRFTDLGGQHKLYFDDALSQTGNVLLALSPLRRTSVSVPTFLECTTNIRPGQCVVVPEKVKEIVFIDNAAEYHKRYQINNKRMEKQYEFLNEFLSTMQRDHIKVLVTGMPVMASNRGLLPEKFWADFRTRVTAMCTKHGAKWLDLTDNPEFTTYDFVDPVHTNDRGGAKVVQAIVRTLISDSEFIDCLRHEQVQASKIAASANGHL